MYISKVDYTVVLVHGGFRFYLHIIFITLLRNETFRPRVLRPERLLRRLLHIIILFHSTR